MSSRLKHLRRAGLVVAASALTALVPVAAAQARTDVRSPDARDAAAAAQVSTGSPSPDARDAARAAQAPASRVDLRSPDARDAALGVSPAASVPQAPAAAPSTVTITERSSQTLAIVFSACALLLALLAVGFVGISRRPRPRWNAP